MLSSTLHPTNHKLTVLLLGLFGLLLAPANAGSSYICPKCYSQKDLKADYCGGGSCLEDKTTTESTPPKRNTYAAPTPRTCTDCKLRPPVRGTKLCSDCSRKPQRAYTPITCKGCKRTVTEVRRKDGLCNRCTRQTAPSIMCKGCGRTEVSKADRLCDGCRKEFTHTPKCTKCRRIVARGVKVCYTCKRQGAPSKNSACILMTGFNICPDLATDKECTHTEELEKLRNKACQVIQSLRSVKNVNNGKTPKAVQFLKKLKSTASCKRYLSGKCCACESFLIKGLKMSDEGMWGTAKDNWMRDIILRDDDALLKSYIYSDRNHSSNGVVTPVFTPPRRTPVNSTCTPTATPNKTGKEAWVTSMYKKGQADWVTVGHGICPQGEPKRFVCWFEGNEGNGYSSRFIYNDINDGYVMYKWDIGIDSKSREFVREYLHLLPGHKRKSTIKSLEDRWEMLGQGPPPRSTPVKPTPTNVVKHPTCRQERCTKEVKRVGDQCSNCKIGFGSVKHPTCSLPHCRREVKHVGGKCYKCKPLRRSSTPAKPKKDMCLGCPGYSKCTNGSYGKFKYCKTCKCNRMSCPKPRISYSSYCAGHRHRRRLNSTQRDSLILLQLTEEIKQSRESQQN